MVPDVGRGAVAPVLAVKSDTGFNRLLKNSLLTRDRTARRKAQAAKAKLFDKLAKFTFANLG